MFILLPLLLLCYGTGDVHCVHDNSTDLHSLLDFKKGVTNDPNGALRNWTTSAHFCRWNGVRCIRGRVSHLILRDQSLAGNVTSSLANLTFLIVLDLSNNRFLGQLALLNGLQQLDTLFLYGNSLEGSIPDALTNCSKLRHLDLNSNQLSGPIPPKVGSLSNLDYLDLSYNNLTGAIPSTLPNLTHLYFCDLQDNLLEGTIPGGIWQSSNMQFLALGFNSFSGEISQNINMSSLQLLALESNRLRKALPSNFGDVLPSLTRLALDINRFEGQIPASLGNASRLLLIDLSVNSFTGHVPASLGKLSSLDSLNLETNKLDAGNRQSWEFLDALANCRSLTKLSLYNNRLQGVIPDSVGNLSTTLQSLSLGVNNITGTVPSTIGNLHNLFRLGLGGNSLSGGTDEWIGKLKNLQGLFLHENMFTGPIPSSISNLTQLTVLFLQRNEFEGQVPSSIGNLSALTVMTVSYNTLNGSIPLGVGNLKQLNELHLSSNNLTGEIPDSLGQCQNLVTAQMDQNILTGGIPVSFGNLKGLNILNLSYNKLSGTIPTALNDLKLLSKLDLSHNHLQGEIPRNGVFKNATAVALDENWGLCGGVAELHMPPCYSVSKKVEWKHNLFRLLITLFGFMTLVMLIYVIIQRKRTSRRPYLLLFSFGKKFPKVSYKDLVQATGNFSKSNLVGRGSYGSVYKGKLTQAKILVAIKVFDLEMKCADKSFVSECEIFRNIRHRNLLPILTACSTIDSSGNDFKALIYEFMHNGNLDTWLHYRRACVSLTHLSLVQRISIAVEVADALAYLHHDCGRPIVHCDVKPTNILLDDDMNAHLGDFGIASLVQDSRSTTVGHSCSNSSISVTGTIGYIAPEYAQSVHASTCGDVYSFGIVLLEVLVGKRPTDSMFKGELSIVSFVERNFRDHILQIVDASLQEECRGFMQATSKTENEVHRCLVSLVQVALSCTSLFPKERMNMKEVSVNLHSIRRSYVTAIKGDQAMLC